MNKITVLTKYGTIEGVPFYGLVGELEFNSLQSGILIPYELNEFYRSIHDGTLSLINEDLKQDIMITYAILKSTNESINNFNKENHVGWVREQNRSRVVKEMNEANTSIKNLVGRLKEYTDTK